MTWTIIQGNALTVLRDLPAESAHCCVTSPPYWGLRDYQTGTWEGGDESCDHKGMPLASSSSSLAGYTSESVKIRTYTVPFKAQCGKCGSLRVDEQIGLESTPEDYVAKMVEVFREVRRVLRDDGTLWLNLGDSYAGSGKGGNPEAGKQSTNRGSQTVGVLYGTEQTARDQAVTNVTRRSWEIGLKPKDLVGIPWRVAFALQADGWWLRSEIIWSKPNPMPESVRDRPTKAHEQVFLLAKSERYYFDQDAVREPAIYAGTVVSLGEKSLSRGQANGRGVKASGNGIADSMRVADGRNIRSVWTISTKPFSGAHFATMPPDLAERCIKAGCPAGGTVLDPFCGAGTTLLVADRLGRNGIGIELNAEYIALARKRIVGDAPLLNSGDLR